ncbi:MAG: MOSC domain-containing protein [Phormidium sp. GEM2.Bin31]|nr:MAG: MOSC domain-containing protein [Phormidium sp. GEM2.Bin31]
MEVKTIFKYPVKGLTPQPCDRVALQKDFGMVGDRAFAFMFTDTGNPQPQTPWLPKKYLAVQNDWGGLAKLRCSYNPQRQELELRLGPTLAVVESVLTQEGRDRLSQFVSDYLQTLTPSPTARHPLATPVRLIGTATGDTHYPDRDRGQISLLSQGTLDEIATKVGQSPLDSRRFRPNFVVDGLPPWGEFDWLGRHLQLGTATIEVLAPLGRCLNIDVNPDTGDLDLPLLSQLLTHFGHAQMGVIARVVEGGFVRCGDTLL